MEKEILSITDAAQILSLPESEVLQLLTAGELPGRRVGAHWFLSRQRLMQFIAGDDTPGTQSHEPVRPAPDSNAPVPERILAPNWRCKGCGAHYGPDVVECTVCGTARSTPLLGYRLPRTSGIAGVSASPKVN